MKLLLFSDLHCDVEATKRLVERANAFDVLIGAGDFARMRKGIEICIDLLKAIERPTVLVPGNNESLEELQAACLDWPAAHVLHGEQATIDGVHFFGLGGGVPVTPFGEWSWDFTEEQARELLADIPDGAILVSHSPPKGAVDVNSSGKHVGSVAVRETVEENQPGLVVCGHIHDCWEQTATIGDSPVINAGPAGIEWNLNQ